MARFWVGHARVGALIEQLARIFLCAPSVNALSDVLNVSLQAAEQSGKIYPNRIRALLSGDPSRGLNESTIELLEHAARTAALTLSAESLARGAALRETLEREWTASTRTSTDLPAVADSTGIPLVFAAQLLGVGQAAHPPSAATLALADTIAPPTSSAVPDWSYQHTATERCLTLLGSKPARRVGLIIPTGGGKTRVALTIGLRMLAEEGSTRRVVWVTHRHNLRAQARKELQEMLTAGAEGVPMSASVLLAGRFEFVMLSGVARRFADPANLPLLVIIDEAHHAAARSYAPIFESLPPVPVLALTATPNRTDGRAIHIDEIAYSITFAELAERGVILRPEFRDFNVDNFDWSDASLADLADSLIATASDEYTKTLVIAPTIERVEAFHAALASRLADEPGHVLAADDVGYLHSQRNSLGVSSDEFLTQFILKPRGILVSAQMLLEGFDDPRVNTVVITYPSSSVVLLMQAAGRCVRWHPEKRHAFVVQARNDRLAYHFDEGWLYRSISDFLRPTLEDVEYADAGALQIQVERLLAHHRVDAHNTQSVLRRLESIELGRPVRILLCGLPYFGSAFATDAKWAAVVDTPDSTAAFHTIFNNYCALGANLADPEPFLREHSRLFGFAADPARGSDWRLYMTMVVSMREAYREVYTDGRESVLGQSRPYTPNGATTWLRYVSFHYHPTVPPALTAFLSDCYNKDAVAALYAAAPNRYALAVKLPLPLGGAEAELHDGPAASALVEVLSNARTTLAAVAPDDQYDSLERFARALPVLPLPMRLLGRLEQLVSVESQQTRTLALPTMASTGQSTTSKRGDQ